MDVQNLMSFSRYSKVTTICKSMLLVDGLKKFKNKIVLAMVKLKAKVG